MQFGQLIGTLQLSGGGLDELAEILKVAFERKEQLEGILQTAERSNFIRHDKITSTMNNIQVLEGSDSIHATNHSCHEQHK